MEGRGRQKGAPDHTAAKAEEKLSVRFYGGFDALDDAAAQFVRAAFRRVTPQLQESKTPAELAAALLESFRKDGETFDVRITPTAFQIRAGSDGGLFIVQKNELTADEQLKLGKEAWAAAGEIWGSNSTVDVDNSPRDDPDTMDTAAAIAAARAILFRVPAAERVVVLKALENLTDEATGGVGAGTDDLANGKPRPEAAATETTTRQPGDGLEWPTEKWKGSPEELSRKRYQIIAFLRRVWKPFIDDNNVIVTREILKEKDADAASALRGYLQYRTFPEDIRIITSEQLREHLTKRPVSANALPELSRA